MENRAEARNCLLWNKCTNAHSHASVTGISLTFFGVLQYADMVANTDKLFLDRGLKIQVNTEKPRLL